MNSGVDGDAVGMVGEAELDGLGITGFEVVIWGADSVGSAVPVGSAGSVGSAGALVSVGSGTGLSVKLGDRVMP